MILKEAGVKKQGRSIHAFLFINTGECAHSSGPTVMTIIPINVAICGIFCEVK